MRRKSPRFWLTSTPNFADPGGAADRGGALGRDGGGAVGPTVSRGDPACGVVARATVVPTASAASPSQASFRAYFIDQPAALDGRVPLPGGEHRRVFSEIFVRIQPIPRRAVSLGRAWTGRVCSVRVGIHRETSVLASSLSADRRGHRVPVSPEDHANDCGRALLSVRHAPKGWFRRAPPVDAGPGPRSLRLRVLPQPEPDYPLVDSTGKRVHAPADAEPESPHPSRRPSGEAVPEVDVTWNSFANRPHSAGPALLHIRRVKCHRQWPERHLRPYHHPVEHN